jgi:tetratricopeptide (TPR) repeat protein
MPEQSTSSGSRSIPRRWRVPGHYLHSAERFEGAGILDENPGPTGLLLWQFERDVRLWALTSPTQREFLFADGASIRSLTALRDLGPAAEELSPPLQALAGMLAHPLEAAADVVMMACRRVSIWAEDGGRYATALRFSESSALAQPRAADCAYHVGRLARRGGQSGLAEGWLNRAIVLARQLGDWETYAAAYSGLGNVSLTRGNLPAADRYHHKALRIATKHSLAGRAGAALHDIFVVAGEAEQVDRAMEYAERALATYPAHHPGRIGLAHDVASVWMDLGDFRNALPVLLVLWRHLPRDQQVIGLANVARAAGALGDRACFNTHHSLAMRELVAAATPEMHPGALLNLARGAASLGDLEEARSLASRAEASAAIRREHKLQFEAEAFLQSLSTEQIACAETLAESRPAATRFARDMTHSIAAGEVAKAI